MVAQQRLSTAADGLNKHNIIKMDVRASILLSPYLLNSTLN
jgi:hypothetical protein